MTDTERLIEEVARAAFKRHHEMLFPDKPAPKFDLGTRVLWEAVALAILDVLMEPGEGACDAGLLALGENGVPSSSEGVSEPDNPSNDAVVCFRAMLKHIKGGENG